MDAFLDFSIVPGSERAFGLFSPLHILWLLAALAAWLLLCRRYRRCTPARRVRMRRVTAGAALAIYISFLHSLRGGELTGQFLYAFCMPGAVCALLFPDWSAYPAFHFMNVSSFTLHILLVGYTLMLVAGGELRPDTRRAPACLGIMLLIAVPVYVFDRLMGTNYMFLNWPLPGSPLEWFAFLGRPGYLLGYIPLLTAAWAVIYGSAWILDKNRGQSS